MKLFIPVPQSWKSAAESKPGPPAPAPERLSVRTFKVDTNTVVAALGETFGIGVQVRQPHEANYSRSKAIENALGTLFDKLGVPLRPDSLFYNGLTGVVMVRASREDMEVVSAAMETLTGLEQKGDPRQSDTGPAERGSRSGMGTALNPLASPAPEAMKTKHPMTKETAAATTGLPEVRIFPLKHADPNQMVDQLKTLFPDTTQLERILTLKAVRDELGHSLPPQDPKLLSLDKEIARLQIIPIPDPRTHSVMVGAPQSLMPHIAEVIQKLDTEPATSGAPPGTAPKP